MSKRVATLAVTVAAVMTIPATGAMAKDYADTSLNIIPSGQYGNVPAPTNLPPGKLPATRQAEMYDGLTPLFDNVNDGDLTTYFKSQALGDLGTDGPGTQEVIPGHPEIQITRDVYNVPHVVSSTHIGGIFAAGWIAAEDRGLLLTQARYNARVAAIDAPGLSAIGLVTSLQNFQPSEQTESVVKQQTKQLKKSKGGKLVLADIDNYIRGINYYFELNSPSTAPFTRNDIYALNALKGQFLGQGGGDEARRSQFLGGLQQKLGKKKGMKVFNDLRQFKNDGAPTTIDGRFNYGKIPKKAPGSVILDPDSYERKPAVALSAQLQREVAPKPAQASNTLMVTGDRSNTGDPLMVGGPQIGYFYPGLTYEIDMQAPGLVWRGATSAPFPGYLLIGRGEDFSTTLTSASADIIDQYVEKLCGGSDTKYVYKGKCRDMGTFNAGTLGGKPVVFNTTVHGAVQGYATVKGKRVAISQKRSSYGKDVLDLLYNRKLSNGSTRDPEDFFRAAAKTPQTFNSFFIDDKHVAEFTAGLLPIRSDKIDPGLPAWGTGQYEWKGFIGRKKHPQGVDPKDGTMTNWNNNVVKGFGTADDQWGRAGSAARVDLLDKNMARLRKGGKKKGTWSLASLTASMNAAATQDVRAIDTVPLLEKLLKGSQPPSERAGQMMGLLTQWSDSGGSRLDLDGDGKIDNPGVAIMDGSWTNIANAFLAPRLGSDLEDELNTLFSRFDLPPSGQYSGWYQYFDRDINSLLGNKVKDPFKVKYCGKGNLKSCQSSIWAAIDASGAQIAAAQGTEDPAAWRSDATREQIKFSPVNIRTMRYTNRPSGIQQVISFDSHRPDKKKNKKK